MRIYVLILCTIFSYSYVKACPELSGTYQCTIDPDEEKDTGVISIRRDVTMESPLYVITDHDYPQNPDILPADGKTYTLEDESLYTGFCDNNNFHYTIKKTDSQYGEMIGDVNLSLTEDGNLKSLGILTFAGKKYESNDTCKKL